MDKDTCIVKIDSHEEFYKCKRRAIKDGLCKIHSKGPLGKLFSFAGNTTIKVGAGYGVRELIEILGGIFAISSMDTANQFLQLEDPEKMSPEDLVSEIERIVNQIHKSGEINIQAHTLDATDAFEVKVLE